MTTKQKIEQFLSAAHSADNLCTAREKLDQAIALLREVSATKAPKMEGNKWCP